MVLFCSSVLRFELLVALIRVDSFVDMLDNLFECFDSLAEQDLVALVIGDKFFFGVFVIEEDVRIGRYLNGIDFELCSDGTADTLEPSDLDVLLWIPEDLCKDTFGFVKVFGLCLESNEEDAVVLGRGINLTEYSISQVVFGSDLVVKGRGKARHKNRGGKFHVRY